MPILNKLETLLWINPDRTKNGLGTDTIIQKFISSEEIVKIRTGKLARCLNEAGKGDFPCQSLINDAEIAGQIGSSQQIIRGDIKKVCETYQGVKIRLVDIIFIIGKCRFTDMYTLSHILLPQMFAPSLLIKYLTNVHDVTSFVKYICFIRLGCRMTF